MKLLKDKVCRAQKYKIENSHSIYDVMTYAIYLKVKYNVIPLTWLGLTPIQLRICEEIDENN